MSSSLIPHAVIYDVILITCSCLCHPSSPLYHMQLPMMSSLSHAVAYDVTPPPPCSNGASAADKTSGSPLTQWTEVNNHPGLICALSQNTSNPCVLMVKPNCIQVHELKAPPNKAKVQGMVALRQPPAGSDPVSSSLTFPPCLTLNPCRVILNTTVYDCMCVLVLSISLG